MTKSTCVYMDTTSRIPYALLLRICIESILENLTFYFDQSINLRCVIECEYRYHYAYLSEFVALATTQ